MRTFIIDGVKCVLKTDLDGNVLDAKMRRAIKNGLRDGSVEEVVKKKANKSKKLLNETLNSVEE